MYRKSFLEGHSMDDLSEIRKWWLSHRTEEIVKICNLVEAVLAEIAGEPWITKRYRTWRT